MDSKFVTVEITVDVFRAMIAEASAFGLKPQAFASNLIVRGVNELSEQIPTDPEVRLYRLAQKSTTFRETRRMLIGIARFLAHNPDEVSADEFISLCEHYGYDPRDLMSAAEQESNLIQGGIEIVKSTGVSKAIAFLVENMPLSDECSATSMLDKAMEQGIKEHWLKEARRMIGVKATRKAAGWYWSMPAKLPSQLMPLSKEKIHVAEAES